jgi:hypothetical protein
MRKASPKDVRPIRGKWWTSARSIAVVFVPALIGAAYGEWYVSQLSGSGPVFQFHRWSGNMVFRLLGGDFANPAAQWQNHAARAVTWFLPVAIISIVVYVLLTACLRRAQRDQAGETRCRRCSYILRGISEPVCPECGEHI